MKRMREYSKKGYTARSRYHIKKVKGNRIQIEKVLEEGDTDPGTILVVP